MTKTHQTFRDLAPFDQVKNIMERIERMRTAYPNDYKQRVGYLTNLDNLVVACRKLVADPA